MGDHTLLLSLIYPNNSFILNEINLNLCYNIYEKLKRNQEIFSKKNRTIKVVLGNEKDLKLEQKVDKIIVRNTFHHFSNKKKMLKSIVKHLNKDGTVIFIEPFKKNTTTIFDCPLRMELEEVMPYINDSKLIIIEEEIINNTLLLSCKVR